jgi:hypothetical protein
MVPAKPLPGNPPRAVNKVPPKPYRKPTEPSQPAIVRRPSVSRLPSREGSRAGNNENRSNSRGSRNGSIDKIRIYGVRDQASKENLNDANRPRSSSRRGSIDQISKVPAPQMVNNPAKISQNAERPRLQRAPSADGRMQYNNNYDSRPRWWG